MLNLLFRITVPDKTAAAQGLPFHVPPGATVRVRALPDNTKPVCVADDPGKALSNTGEVIAANTEIFYPLANLAQLFVAVQVNGEGVQITLKG